MATASDQRRSLKDDSSELIKAIRNMIGSQEEVDNIIRWIQNAELRIVVVGKTGVGKSTLLNTFLGVNDFEEGDSFRHVTDEVKERRHEKNGVKVTVWDCPGLQDGTGKEERYLRELKRKTNGDIHLMLYCIDMKETRSDLHWGTAIDKITEILGKDIWNYTAIVLTFANTYERRLKKSEKPEDVEKIFTDRVNEWREKMQQKLKSINGIEQSTIDAIQVMPAGKYSNKPLCGQKHWLSNLWAGILNKVRQDVQHAVVKINEDRFCMMDEVEEEFCIIDVDEHRPLTFHDQSITLTPTVQQAIGCEESGADSKFGSIFHTISTLGLTGTIRLLARALVAKYRNRKR